MVPTGQDQKMNTEESSSKEMLRLSTDTTLTKVKPTKWASTNSPP